MTANDNFANARLVTITGTDFNDTQANTGFTTETGEPLPFDPGNGLTAWWNYTPSTNGTVTVDTGATTTLPGNTSGTDTVLAVYTGTALGSLTQIASNDDDGWTGTATTHGSPNRYTSWLQFSATAGVTYRIQVGAYGNDATYAMTYGLHVNGPVSMAPPLTVTETDVAGAVGAAVYTVRAVTNNAQGGRIRRGSGSATWAPPVPATPPPTAQVYDAALAFSVPPAGGSSVPWQPKYTVSTMTAKRHRTRIVVGGVDITNFRDTATPEPTYQLQEPLLYGPATIALPQVRPAFEQLGVGVLAWCRKGAQVLIQRVDVDTNAVVATDYVGFVLMPQIQGDSLTLQVGGECQGRLALIEKQVELRDYQKDVGWFAWYWMSNWRIPFLPAQGPTTGITLGTAGGMTALSYIQDLVTQARTAGGVQYTIAPGIGAAAGTSAYGMAPKDTATIHGTVYLDDKRCVGELHSDLAEEPNRIFATAVGPDGRRIRGAVYPGLVQGATPPYPFNDGRAFTAPTTDADTDTGDGVSVMVSRLIVAGYLNAADVVDASVWDATITAAVEALRKDLGRPVLVSMNPAVWDDLFDVSATNWTMTGSRILPMAQADAVRPWNLTASGSETSRNSTYDPSVPWVDLNVDMGTGFTKPRVRAWAQSELTDDQSPNWVGMITITTGGIPSGSHTPGDPVTSMLRARDIKPGMNLRLPLFQGGITVHVAAATVTGAADGDLGTVQLMVDTRARDALKVWAIIERNRASRKSPARRWLDDHRASTQNKDAIVEWDDVGGQIQPIKLDGGQWNVFPVVAGQEGQVEQLHMTLTNGGTKVPWCMAIFGRRIHANQLQHLVGDPFSTAAHAKWNDQSIRSQLDDTFVLLYAAGDFDNPCGYYPGMHSNGDSATGVWRDDSGFAYRCFDGPVLWVAIYPSSSGTLHGGRIMWNQIGSGS